MIRKRRNDLQYKSPAVCLPLQHLWTDLPKNNIEMDSKILLTLGLVVILGCVNASYNTKSYNTHNIVHNTHNNVHSNGYNTHHAQRQCKYTYFYIDHWN
ncbi:hypothetical protein EB796_015256 [Bugula neritina]|uniref:Uncharacterized protein n=1 Tax=Bugula neritina TaxID=10212 RepID=A0A7J7JJG9_BUGNE|nr:hypothetical protein EB796_015256 [Bugula neritina]